MNRMNAAHAFLLLALLFGVHDSSFAAESEVQALTLIRTFDVKPWNLDSNRSGSNVLIAGTEDNGPGFRLSSIDLESGELTRLMQSSRTESSFLARNPDYLLITEPRAPGTALLLLDSSGQRRLASINLRQGAVWAGQGRHPIPTRTSRARFQVEDAGDYRPARTARERLRWYRSQPPSHRRRPRRYVRILHRHPGFRSHSSRDSECHCPA